MGKKISQRTTNIFVTYMTGSSSVTPDPRLCPDPPSPPTPSNTTETSLPHLIPNCRARTETYQNMLCTHYSKTWHLTRTKQNRNKHMDTGGFVCFFFLQKVKVNHTNCLHLHNVSDKGKQIPHSKHVCQTHFTFWKEKKKEIKSELLWATGADSQ